MTIIKNSRRVPPIVVGDGSLRAQDLKTVNGQSLVGTGDITVSGGGGGVTDGDKGDVIVSGSGAVWGLDYTAVNPVIAPTWANVTGKPTTLVSDGDKGDVVVSGSGTVWNADSSTVGMLAGTQTFTGDKTFSGAVNVTDSLFTLSDDADPTKLAKFQLSGITTGVTRTFTLINTSGTIPTHNSTFNVTGPWTFSGGFIGKTGSLFTLQDGTDATKQAQFDASGITTATTRTYTLPNASGTLVLGGGTATGTNTGDQTSIVGITGTIAQFNTAVTDADIATTTAANTFTGIQTIPSLNLSVQSIATAAGTTTLTSASVFHTVFTGSTTQTIALPNATSLANGHRFKVSNNSTGLVTVQTNGGATFWTLGAATDIEMVLTDNSTSAGSWEKDYRVGNSATGKVSTFNNSITFAGTDGTTMTFPGSNATIPSNAVVTSGANGLAPASGGGTTNYLRADGTWAAPPGSGGGVTDGDKGDIIVSSGGTVWSADTTTVGMLAGTQTFTGDKTFSGTTSVTGYMAISEWEMQDGTDPTKVTQFDLSGLTTGTTRTMIVPDGSGKLYAGNSGTASVDFGTGNQNATLAITGQSNITAGARIKVWLQGGSTTDWTDYAHQYLLPLLARFTAGVATAATGFTIYATSDVTLRGLVSVQWEWSN